MSLQSELILFLKQKGTGVTMGKSLTKVELERISTLFCNYEVDPVTASTLLTAILTLPPTQDELAWIDGWLRSNSDLILPDLRELLPWFKGTKSVFLEKIHRVIQGQLLTESEARDGMLAVLDPTQPLVLKAAFLEALRLRRESILENQTFYGVLWSETVHCVLDIPFLLDFSVAYDGYNRTGWMIPFVAAVLAASGMPVVLHGASEMGPKYGMNTEKILHQACKKSVKSIQSLGDDLRNPELGWAYVDVNCFAPKLGALIPLRKSMVKRPCLATLEKLLGPFLASKTGILTSYTHPPYRQTLKLLLENRPEFDLVMIVRGAEGGIQFSLDRKTPIGDDVFVRPEAYGFNSDLELDWDKEKVLNAEWVLDQGVLALNGVPGLALDTVVYLSSVVLKEFGSFETPEAAVAKVMSVIDSGEALKRWNRGML